MNTNEQAPECCPFCGTGKKRHLPHIAFRWFECGTMTAPAKTPRRDQTPACADAERERLTRERDDLATRATVLAVQVSEKTKRLDATIRENERLNRKRKEARDRVESLENVLRRMLATDGGDGVWSASRFYEARQDAVALMKEATP